MVRSVKLTSLSKIFIFDGSRKVSLGLYLFIVSTLLLIGKFITPGDWLTCVFLSSGLIGGGTLGDRWLEIKNKETPTAPPPPR